MAGTYPTAPALRIAYDDPSVADVFARRYVDYGGGLVQFTESSLQAMNGDVGSRQAAEVTSIGTTDRVWNYQDTGDLYFLFQEPIDFSGVFCVARWWTDTTVGLEGGTYGNASIQVYTSEDTTNGVDGTWTNRGQLSALTVENTTIQQSNQTPPPDYLIRESVTVVRSDGGVYSGRWGGILASRNYRTAIRPLEASRVVGVRMIIDQSGASTFRNPDTTMLTVHFYGALSPAPGRRIDFWAPHLNLPLTPDVLDWGDVEISSSEDRVVRLKNSSQTETALDIKLSREASPYYQFNKTLADFLFSVDGEEWHDELTVAALAPGTVSNQIRVRRVVPANHFQGVLSPRISVSIGSWK